MRTLRSGAAVAAMLVIAGCAGPTTNGQVLRGVGPCLPPEISAQFFFWPVVAMRSIALNTEDGEAVEASWVLYRRGRNAVAVVWLHSDLISVDPSPETETPEWIDHSLVTPVEGQLVLRREAEAPCQWKRWETPADASSTHSRGRVVSR
jgi:hypothetical protein